MNYGSQKTGKSYTEEEDQFLLCMTQEIGYGYWEELKAEVRKAWQFRFDWYALVVYWRCEAFGWFAFLSFFCFCVWIYMSVCFFFPFLFLFSLLVTYVVWNGV